MHTNGFAFIRGANRRAMTHTKSDSLFEHALALIPGGVNSPVRACRSVGCNPPFIARGEGGHIFDADAFTCSDV